jgi:hypothetical protein
VAIEELQPLKKRFALENNISLLERTILYLKEKIKIKRTKGGTDTNFEKDCTIEDVIESSDQLNLKSLSNW